MYDRHVHLKGAIPMLTDRMPVFVGLYCFLLPAGCGASPPDRDARVSGALSQYVCYVKHWQKDETYRLAKPVALDYVVAGGRLSVRVEGLVLFPHARMVSFFDGAIVDGQAAIWGAESYNVGLEKNPYLVKRQATFSDASKVESVAVALPGCDGHFEPVSGEKASVVAGIKQALGEVMQAKGGSASDVILGDFRLDDPDTYAYVPASDSLYTIRLHDVSDYFGHPFDRSGYPVEFVGRGTQSEMIVSDIKADPIYLRWGIANVSGD
jgi:hypothetical protein